MPGSFRDLKVFQKAFSFAMKIYGITIKFPKEEKYELTDQIRRSSRAICRAIGEGYRKRQYPRHFTAKMSDADMENTETQVSLDFALSCEYITMEIYQELIKNSEEIGRMLNHMITYPEKYHPRKQN
jgi:four helix bundle protein